MSAPDLDPLIALGGELERLDDLEKTCPDAWSNRVSEQVYQSWDQIEKAIPTSIEGALVQARLLRRLVVGNDDAHYLDIVDNLIAGLERLAEG